MGMYPELKEVPLAVIEQLLARPRDAAATDALLFVSLPRNTVEWTEIARRSTLSDAVLAERFASAMFPVSVEARRELGTLELGKYPDHLDEAFGYFLRAAALPHDVELASVLEPELPPEVEAARWEAILPEPGVPDEPHVPADGPIGFATDVVCYGINGHRMPAELAELWAIAERGVARFARHRDRLVARFEHELRYHEGCARRGSGELSLMW